MVYVHWMRLTLWCNFQVSWSQEHKTAGAGTYQVSVYDEEGYSNIRKARRDGETADVKPVATLEVNHQVNTLFIDAQQFG